MRRTEQAASGYMKTPPAWKNVMQSLIKFMVMYQ